MTGAHWAASTPKQQAKRGQKHPAELQTWVIIPRGFINTNDHFDTSQSFDHLSTSVALCYCDDTSAAPRTCSGSGQSWN